MIKLIKHGFSVMLAVAMLTPVCAFLTGCDNSLSSEDMKQVRSMVNDILKDDRSIAGSARCKRIEIGKKVNSGYYKANAILDNGEKLKINIKFEGDDIIVEIGVLEQAKAIVNEILKDERPLDAAKCLKVRITERIDKNHCRGIAVLDNGYDLAITIETKGDSISVGIIDQ